MLERKDRNRGLFGKRERWCLLRCAHTILDARHRRADIAIASSRQCLDPAGPPVLIQDATERGDLYGKIAVLDSKSRPGRLYQGVFRDRICSVFQK